MNRATLALIVFAAALTVGCSGPLEATAAPTTSQTIPGFNVSSRTTIDGRLLRLEGGATFGLLESRRTDGSAPIVHAELMMLQRMPTSQHPGQSEPTAATSQVWEVDCSTGQNRIVANIGYARSGKVLTVLPISVAPSRPEIMVGVFEAICDDTYEEIEVRRFSSIAEFLDLFDQGGTPSASLDPPETIPPAGRR